MLVLAFYILHHRLEKPLRLSKFYSYNLFFKVLKQYHCQIIVLMYFVFKFSMFY
jgi:hypothetical protein